MTAIVTIGIDLAKNVFAVYGVDATSTLVLLCANVLRAKLLEVIAALPNHGSSEWKRAHAVCRAAANRWRAALESAPG